MGQLPLLLLPGTLCDATLFGHQVNHLVDVAMPMVIDVHHQDNLHDVAQYILQQVDALGSERFAVAGLSYGGIVAFELWRQAPHRIAKIALLNTNPHEAAPQTKASQQRFVGMAHLGEFRAITTDFLKDVMLHPDHRKDQELRQKVLNMAQTIGVEGFVNEVKAQLARPSAIPDLQTITCPTLILTGREDQVVPVVAHEQMARLIPHSRLVIVEHCGHLSTMEQPEIVTQALRDWLTEEGLWREKIP
ncbi:MAG: alpha/beta hydrolase [Aggregatilineales bacterium]